VASSLLGSIGSLGNLLSGISNLLRDSLGSSLGGVGDLLLDLLSLISDLLLDGLLVSGFRSLVGIDLPLAVLLDEVGKVLDGTGTSVFNWRSLGASWEKLDGWEALDLIWNIVGSSVDLGDDDLVTEILVESGELIVLGGQSLAVTAPWGVELEEDILVVLDDKVVVGVGDNDGDWSLLLLWNWLRLDGWRDLALGVVLNKLGDGLLGELLILWEWELGVLGGFLDSESWPLGLKVEVWSVSTESDGVNGSEVDLALELLSEWANLLGESLLGLWGVEEDVGEWDTGRHVSLVGVWADLTNQWGGSSLGELGDLLSLKLAIEDNLAFIEGLVENNSWGLNTLRLGESGIGGDTEEVVVTERVGDTVENLVRGLVVLSKVGNNDNLIGLLEVVMRGDIELGDGWERLLGHVGNNGIRLAWAGVCLVVVDSTEDLDGWVALNLESLAKIGFLGTVTADSR
jgi:hypothetical protein